MSLRRITVRFRKISLISPHSEGPIAFVASSRDEACLARNPNPSTGQSGVHPTRNKLSCNRKIPNSYSPRIRYGCRLAGCLRTAEAGNNVCVGLFDGWAEPRVPHPTLRPRQTDADTTSIFLKAFRHHANHLAAHLHRLFGINVDRSACPSDTISCPW